MRFDNRASQRLGSLTLLAAIAIALAAVCTTLVFRSRVDVPVIVCGQASGSPDGPAVQTAAPDAAAGKRGGWLPTRSFDCPRCSTPVPTNDNALPILLLGFLGQGAFGLRFFVQWIASERARASVIPEAFWWLSIAGGILLLLYGWMLLAWPLIIGQGLNCLIYGRNLAFVRIKEKEGESFVPVS